MAGKLERLKRPEFWKTRCGNYGIAGKSSQCFAGVVCLHRSQGGTTETSSCPISSTWERAAACQGCGPRPRVTWTRSTAQDASHMLGGGRVTPLWEVLPSPLPASTARWGHPGTACRPAGHLSPPTGWNRARGASPQHHRGDTDNC